MSTIDSAAGYLEWVMGELRPKSVIHGIAEIDPDSGVLFARNPYNTEFTDQVAFFEVDAEIWTITGFPPKACGNDVSGLWPLYSVELY